MRRRRSPTRLHRTSVLHHTLVLPRIVHPRTSVRRRTLAAAVVAALTLAVAAATAVVAAATAAAATDTGNQLASG